MAFWRSDMMGRSQQHRKNLHCPKCAENSRKTALLQASLGKEHSLVMEQAAKIDALKLDLLALTEKEGDSNGM